MFVPFILASSPYRLYRLDMETVIQSWLPDGVVVRQDWATVDWRARGAVISGSPALLSRICARLGFKNDCRKGSVYITAAKVRWLQAQAVSR